MLCEGEAFQLLMDFSMPGAVELGPVSRELCSVLAFPGRMDPRVLFCF